MIDFDKMIDNHLTRDRKPKEVGRYYPSEIGGCIRKLWFSYKHPKQTDPELLKIFEMGNILHDFVADVIKSEKNPEVELVNAEMPFEIKMKNFIISGRVDDVVLIKSSNKNILVEVKSCSDIEKLSDAKHQHKIQLQLYMFATKIREGILLYIDKKNLRSKVFTIEYDESESIKSLERFSILHECLTQDVVPEAEGKISTEHYNICQFCEYKDECHCTDGVLFE